MKVSNSKFYVLGFFSLVMMGGVVVYSFRTLFESLGTAFTVDTQIPESELRINRQNLEKAYNMIYDSEPTKLNLDDFVNRSPAETEKNDDSTSEIDNELSD
ncbi:hypothetical protein JXA63_01940 [Candidatus Woesebacteria bacterium]|nr:hypothetical protein [Candidatus Woesebacteria bacterium]